MKKHTLENGAVILELTKCEMINFAILEHPFLLYKHPVNQNDTGELTCICISMHIATYLAYHDEDYK